MSEHPPSHLPERVSPFDPGAIGAGSAGQGATTTRFWWVRHAPVEHHGRILRAVGYAVRLYRCFRVRWTSCGSCRAMRSGLRAICAARTRRRGRSYAPACRDRPDPAPTRRRCRPRRAEFGDWQGLTYDELRHSRGGAFHRFWHAPAHERAPGGESFIDVMQRVARTNSFRARRQSRPRHHSGGAWRHDPRRAWSGARPRPGGVSRLHDGKLLDHAHRPYRRPRHGARLARRDGQSPAAVKAQANSRSFSSPPYMPATNSP